MNISTVLLLSTALLAGSAAELAERISEIAARGARNLFIPSVFGDPAGYARRLAKEVLPAFRGARIAGSP